MSNFVALGTFDQMFRLCEIRSEVHPFIFSVCLFKEYYNFTDKKMTGIKIDTFKGE
jgi:hypothetical protein